MMLSSPKFIRKSASTCSAITPVIPARILICSPIGKSEIPFAPSCVESKSPSEELMLITISIGASRAANIPSDRLASNSNSEAAALPSAQNL